LPLLGGTACITVLSYVGSNAHVLVNESWYYIVLHESFNFSLGVVIAGWWLGDGRRALERVTDDPLALGAAFVVFAAGSVANWSPWARPFASMLYGPSLVLMIAFLARRLETVRFARPLASVDSYDLYLVHQPFAFPIAFAASVIFHGYAVFVGWFVFVAVALVATRALSIVQRPFFEASLPAPPTSARRRVWHPVVKRPASFIGRR
jgi:hypothetical protein